MTLQQLRYLIAIAEYGSINAAAAEPVRVAVQPVHRRQGSRAGAGHHRVHAQQPRRDAHERRHRAAGLCAPGDRAGRHAGGALRGQRRLRSLRLAVSTQHYAFSVQAFVNVHRSAARATEYEFILRERATGEIIDDVRTFRSEVGILYTDDVQPARAVARRSTMPTWRTSRCSTRAVHVFVGEHHPLARRARCCRPDDLADYPALLVRAGHVRTRSTMSEEPLAAICRTNATSAYSDRGTLTNLLTSYNGYTLSTGVLSAEMHSGHREHPAWTWTSRCRWATSCTTSAARAPCFCATSPNCRQASARTPRWKPVGKRRHERRAGRLTPPR